MNHGSDLGSTVPNPFRAVGPPRPTHGLAGQSGSSLPPRSRGDSNRVPSFRGQATRSVPCLWRIRPVFQDVWRKQPWRSDRRHRQPARRASVFSKDEGRVRPMSRRGSRQTPPHPCRNERQAVSRAGWDGARRRHPQRESPEWPQGVTQVREGPFGDSPSCGSPVRRRNPRPRRNNPVDLSSISPDRVTGTTPSSAMKENSDGQASHPP